jgi:hypothetical protein
MQGNVYQIAAPRHGNQPHLHVVVLEFSGNKDCIVVPAFSAAGMLNFALTTDRFSPAVVKKLRQLAG